MEKKLIITLVILTIITLIIIAAGCGDSGDNAINPTSISNQGNTGNNPESTGGYINVNITWPQDGIEGKCVITSGSENT